VNVIVGTVPSTLLLQGITVANGDNICYNATQTITVAGGGTSFIVQNGGKTVMIAGQEISYLPGTRVFPGGYLHGYITTTGQYCTSIPPPLAPLNTDVPVILPNFDDGSLFNVYPNPTTGRVTVELSDKSKPGIVTVSVFGTCGNLVLTRSLRGESKYDFSLEGSPDGMYFIRVTGENRGLTKKLIKQ
jgi:hypothetical protein